ncbi:MAG: hypothetical protein H0X37_04270 [Herpetosiphonaceae bacterium]|nr:hypothetical protein [Herpetosiphonaceae bacterium]
MQSFAKRWKWVALACLLLALSACGPEDGRVRGQLGADVNNKPIPYSPYTVLNGPQPIQPHSKVWSSSRP